MIVLTLDELFAYTDEERGKWRLWFDTHPAAMDIRLQPGGRFDTVAALVDHIFLVETRHLARLQRHPVPEASGVQSAMRRRYLPMPPGRVRPSAPSPRSLMTSRRRKCTTSRCSPAPFG